jgi:hypothetical protein
MAMIKCPACGKSVSDKAEKCIYCGQILNMNLKKVCTECGAELDERATVCNKCGCPVEPENSVKETVTQSSQVEETGIKNKIKISKKTLIIAAAAVVLIIAAIFGIIQIQKQSAIKKVTAYSKNIENITYAMLDSAADTENCGNLFIDVWHNSIYKIKDSSTDKYTRMNDGSGSFYSDFNAALSNLVNDSNFNNSISKIRNDKDAITALMKDMKNPPEECEDAYKALQDCYDAYLNFTSVIINASGSLNSFSSSFNSADETFAACYGRMEQYFN